MQSSPLFPTPACHSTSVSLLSLSTSVFLRNWGNFGSPRVCDHKMYKDLRKESDELEGSACLCARTCAHARGVLCGGTWKMVRKCNMTAVFSELRTSCQEQ